MKTKTLNSLLIFIMMYNLSSCDFKKGDFPHDLPHTGYSLFLRFQDTSGNDLIQGIDYSSGVVNSDLYTLNIVFSEPCNTYDTDIFNFPPKPGFFPDNNFPKLLIGNSSGHSHLIIDFILPTNDCPEEKMVTYKLKCPYIFGDDNVHELVAYWNFSKVSSFCTSADCYSAEFDGKEFIPTRIEDNFWAPTSLITVLLK